MTGSYNVAIKKSAERELRFVPSADLRRITDRIATLAHNPRPAGSENPPTVPSSQGDYRICIPWMMKSGETSYTE